MRLFTSRHVDPPSDLGDELLPTTSANENREKYRRRRLSFPGWTPSSTSSRETKISITELVCVLGAFVVLTYYANRSDASTLPFKMTRNGRHLPSSNDLGGGASKNFVSTERASPLSSSSSSFASVSPSRGSSTHLHASSSSSSSSSSLSSSPSSSNHAMKHKNGGPRIAAAITTSKRPELFRRAYLSFRLRCLDCDAMVDQWYAVDDGSPDEQLEAMHAVSSDVVWLDKSKGAKNETGHVSSLNRIFTEVVDRYDYLVFLEDDFFFVQDEDYVAKALDIFKKNESIGQIVFNRRYSLTNTKVEDANQVGGIEVRDPHTKKITHILHEYIGPAGSPEWNAYFEKHPGIGSVHWPHFSLNSGIWKLKALKDVGTFEQRDGFEFFYGLRWMKKGYVTAFFPGKYSIHLGKPLPNSSIPPEDLDAMYKEQGLRHSVAGTASAYDLNGAIR